MKAHASPALPPGKKPGNHCTGDWVDPRSGPKGGENIASTDIRSPAGPARSEVAIPTALSRLYALYPIHIILID